MSCISTSFARANTWPLQCPDSIPRYGVQLERLIRLLIGKLPSLESRLYAGGTAPSPLTASAAPRPVAAHFSASEFPAGSVLEEAPSSSGAALHSRPGVPDIDLQRAAPSVVARVKEEMDVVFKMNQKPKGHEGYVYDVRVDFTEGGDSNEWDDGDD
jgi:hypothetical protein